MNYDWAFVFVPENSAVILINAKTSTPNFIVDLPGTYIVSLIVKDAADLSSTPSEVVVSSLNTPPVADAGPDKGTYVGNAVTFDGTASSDPDLDPITYTWALIGLPADSIAYLVGDPIFPMLQPDLPGIYEVELIVNDGFTDSTPDKINVIVITVQEFSQQKIMDALNIITLLSPSSVTTPGNQTALSNTLLQAIKSLQKNNIVNAKRKLQGAIERTDGCALRGSVDGAGGGNSPPKRDYINNCADQSKVYPLLREAIDLL